MIIRGANTGISIKVLDDSNAEDCRAAAVRGLDKFSLYVPWIQQEGKTDRNGNAAKRSAETKGQTNFVSQTLIKSDSATFINKSAGKAALNTNLLHICATKESS